MFGVGVGSFLTSEWEERYWVGLVDGSRWDDVSSLLQFLFLLSGCPLTVEKWESAKGRIAIL